MWTGSRAGGSGSAVLGSNHVSQGADRLGATLGADARSSWQAPGFQNLLHPLESLEMMMN